MAAVRPDIRALPLYEVPPPVHYEFCRVMDALSIQDWTKFASEVLPDTTAVQLAKKKEDRTDSLMLQWQNRNGSVGELLDLLQKLKLLRPRDIINNWASSFMSPSRFNSPHGPPPTDPSAALPTCPLNQSAMAEGPAMLLPKPQPPELGSAPLCDLAVCTSGVMAWAYEEVHAGTCGFCSALKVGEGGFGEVYRASLRNTDCAVKKFKTDCSLDWKLLRDSFKTEVEKLSKFRHPNIVDLLGYSDVDGTYCLIYSFMENRSLDDQLRPNGICLSWSQRVSIVKGAAKALQYLHCPPEGQTPLVHGDVKSSNILLDRHLEAKLADFGLAQFMPGRTPGRTAAQTCSLGTTQVVRGTLAYLPEDYIRGSKLNTAVDVYSFGVVLLEILTGRRALEKDKKTGRDIYLKDLVKDVEDSEAEWRKQLDKRLLSCGAAVPSGFTQVVSLARSCCSDKWKKRPSMTEVYKTLHKLNVTLNPSSSSPSSLPSDLDSSATTPPHPRPPRSLDSCFSAMSLNTEGPSEHTYYPKPSSLSPPQTLHSSTVSPKHPPHASSSPPPLCSSFDGPCETDESRGYSQYDIKSNGFFPEQSSCEPLSRPTQATQPSVPTEDQFNFPQASGLPECSSPAESLQSHSPVVLNPSKLHLLEKIARYDQGLIRTPELLSTEDHYLVRSPAESRLPEESDELEYLQSKTQ
uniref:Interleukin-1 receptor-associated kinase 1 n=1 Tax=Neogobius melanostomus TaxID=47308 RepID=A0A8C6S4N2_9GOBI